MTVTLETEEESRVRQIEVHYGSLASRTSVVKTAMNLGLLLMAAELGHSLLSSEKEQLGKLKKEICRWS